MKVLATPSIGLSEHVTALIAGTRSLTGPVHGLCIRRGSSQSVCAERPWLAATQWVSRLVTVLSAESSRRDMQAVQSAIGHLSSLSPHRS